MLEVQSFIKHKGVDQLEPVLGISTNYHADGRVILNYSQIDSPKLNPIVRECRGLVLDSTNDYKLVARSFQRFFNWMEFYDEQRTFNWEGCHAQHKEDGSLITVYNHNGAWYVNTRNSFGESNISSWDISWNTLVRTLLPKNFETTFNPKYSYVFELCTKFNKVVRLYQESKLYLLSMFDLEFNRELSLSEVDLNATQLGLDRPNVVFFEAIDEVEEYINDLSSEDSSFEGVVLRDINNIRFKLKTATYVALHRMMGDSGFTPKNILPLILANETEEVLVYFPEIKDKVDSMSALLMKWEKEIDNLWFCYHDEESRKKFALAVKHHPISWALFEAKDTGVHPVQIMRSKPERLLKYMEDL